MDTLPVLKLAEVRPNTRYIGVRCKSCGRSIYVIEDYPPFDQQLRLRQQQAFYLPIECERCGHRDAYNKAEFRRCASPPSAGGTFFP